jgi:hypothetical protein
MHRLVKTEIKESSIPVPFEFQPVRHQVDTDGILRKDFLQKMKAQICYESSTVEFKGKHFNFAKTLINKEQLEKEKFDSAVKTITLQKKNQKQ